MLLEGKVGLIAGVGPGLGREVALLFARHGAKLVLGARRRERTEAVADEVRAAGGKVDVVELDVCDQASCDDAVAATLSAYGGMDILVNNAFHTGDFARFEEADPQSWRRTMDVNLWGTLQMTRGAVPALGERSGRVVMVNTMSAWRHQPRFGAYTISKAALESATKMLAVELGPLGIRVNGIHPGYIWGDSVKGYLEHQAQERGVSAQVVHDEVADESCLKYIPPASEVAGSVLFLASDLAAPITGQSLGVNAGAWLH